MACLCSSTDRVLNGIQERNGGVPELVTAISSVPPGAFNPRKIEPVPLSCWCTGTSERESGNVSFWWVHFGTGQTGQED
jgi:hypothetical protein